MFGAALAKAGDATYEESVLLGKLLVQAGFGPIWNGGYMGAMEGVSRGAVEAGGEAVGVLVPTLFPTRNTAGNSYLTRKIDTPTLLTRIECLVQNASYFICLPGTLGTLTELCAAWNTATLNTLRDPTATRAVIVVYRKPWEAILKACASDCGISADHMSYVRVVDDAAEAVQVLCEARHAREREGRPAPATATVTVA